VVHKKYCPPLICLNPGVQFFIRTKYEKPPAVKIHKNTLTLPDRGVIALDRISSLNKAVNTESDYVIMISPGVRETTHSTKILSMASDLINFGFSNIYVMNYRGSCSIPLMSKQMSHACDGYNDITAGVEELMRSYPGKKILLIGACVGGQCVVDYLASPHATHTPAVVGGVIHSCIWELSKKNFNVSSGINYHLFNKLFVKDVVSRVFKYSTDTERKLREEWFSECGVDQEELKKVKTIWEFEEYVFSRVYGWSGAEDYYNRVSPSKKIHQVSKPLIWINARDDFLAPFKDFDLDVIEKNPHVVLWSTASGGHVSFVETLFPVTSYLSRAVPECAQLLCQFVQQTNGEEEGY